MNTAILTLCGLALLYGGYLILKVKRKVGRDVPNYFYPVLQPSVRYKVLDVNGFDYDLTVLDQIEDSFERLKGLAPYYQTNYKDLMYLQLHLDHGRKLEDFGISEDIYNELIDRVDDFFMDKLAFGTEPKGGKRYYLPASLEDNLIGYH